MCQKGLSFGWVNEHTDPVKSNYLLGVLLTEVKFLIMYQYIVKWTVDEN